MRHFIITAIVLFIMTLLLQIDNPLSPGAKDWIAKLNQDNDSRAYRYLMGIPVANEDPAVVGDKIVANIRHAEQSFFNGEGFQYEDIILEKLALSDGEWYCNFEDKTCIETLMESLAGIESTLDENQELLQRYQKFLAFGDFQVLSNPLFNSPLPPYQYLSRAHRLHLLSLTKDFLESPNDPTYVQAYINQLESYQTSANTLISKMIFTKYLSDVIDILWYLKQTLAFEKLPILSTKTPAEMGFDKAIIYEFGFAYNIYQNLDKHPEILEQADDLPTWSVRLLFKPNMTINAAYEHYQKVMQSSMLSPKEYLHMLDQPQDDGMPLSIRNPIGLILLRVAQPDFKSFIGRVHNLNIKNILLEGTNVNVDGSLEYSHLSNPYFEFPTAPNQQQNRLCFENPFDESKQMETCVHIH